MNISALVNSVKNFFWEYIYPSIELLGLAHPFSKGRRIYYIFLLSALLLTVLLYIRSNYQQSHFSIRDYLKRTFPRSVWLHKSSRLDAMIFFLNNLLKSLVFIPLFLSKVSLMYIVVRFWDKQIGVLDYIEVSKTGIAIAYTFTLLIVGDFSRFLLHYALHRWDFLWQFHKVHHSAEVLTPLTLYRVHPLESMLYYLRSTVVFALVTGTFYFFFRGDLSLVSLFGINAGMFIFNLLGANLRHSHVWWSWGSRLEHIFISPAQHQIHHSTSKEHHNKNMGSILAIWDWLFGTLWVNKERPEQLEFGIEKEEQKNYQSFWGLLLSPVKGLFSKKDK